MDRSKALTLDPTITSLFAASGLPAPTAATPLSGGVSCDVWRVESGGHLYAVKRALPQLRTAAEWLAPVERAESEVAWLKRVAAIAPAAVPRVVAEDPATHSFAMTFLADAPVWKDELMAGRVDPGVAAALGRPLAQIHAATADDPAVAAEFATMPLFDALRIDPFVRYVAAREPGLAPRLDAIAADLASRKVALVHGDVSPKNILVGRDGPVILDAECAVYGDPAFDVAFCVTHLLLKLVHLPAHSDVLRDAARALGEAYLAGVTWEDRDAIAARAGTLVATLALARVAGKSPAPYLVGTPGAATVRDAARALLRTERSLLPLIESWPA